MSQELRTNPPRSTAFAGESPPPASAAARWLYRHVPAFDSLRTYTLPAFGADLMAGLTVATVAVPQAMAYATLAGLPPQMAAAEKICRSDRCANPTRRRNPRRAC